MAESMEKVSKKCASKAKEELGIPLSGSGKEKKDKKAGEKKKKTKDGADEKSEESEKSGSGSGSENEEEEADEVPFEQKVQFTEKVRRLTNDGLTRLVK